MTTVVPSLSTAGWITATAQKADALMAHIYESMANQSYTYAGSVTSIQSIIQANAGNMPKTCSALQSALEAYLGRYYDSVLAQVTSDDVTAGNTTSLITVSIYAQVTENGVTYPYYGLVQLADSKFLKATKLNNNGPSVASTVVN
ncbi:hypothetical protein [Paraburkholderia sp. BCC1886]|uniref:hypothetical protein n=1 Tax=Paraburkholderia sp. BCC1886 TaxID=2562670 RepID=UPI0011841E0D|nr:hypothetical protein [Paraburkholderia sp. BCC1886]